MKEPRTYQKRTPKLLIMKLQNKLLKNSKTSHKRTPKRILKYFQTSHNGTPKHIIKEFLTSHNGTPKHIVKNSQISNTRTPTTFSSSDCEEWRRPAWLHCTRLDQTPRLRVGPGEVHSRHCIITKWIRINMSLKGVTNMTQSSSSPKETAFMQFREFCSTMVE